MLKSCEILNIILTSQVTVSKNVNVSITTLTPCLESAVVVFGKIVEISSVYYGIIISICK